MEFGDELRYTELEKWVEKNNLRAGEDLDQEFLIGLTISPLFFEDGTLGANFVLSGMIGMHNPPRGNPYALECVWRCIYICESLRGTP